MQVLARPPKRRRRRLSHFVKQDSVGERKAEATTIETNIEASAPDPQGTTTTSTTEPKKKQDKKRMNQYPKKEVCYVITLVSPEG
jgi:hypothetical protein